MTKYDSTDGTEYRVTTQTVDLRSDTVTQPSAGMRRAMANAVVGDDGYDEDPTVQTLQEGIAHRFGHEAALFVPSGTMANQISLQALLAPGDELLCATDAELVNHAHGALAALGGISTRTLTSTTGLLDPDEVAAVLSRAGYFTNPTRAIAVEQTSNRVGGRIYPLDDLIALRKVAADNDAALVCDGARIWNAHMATGVPLDEYGRLFDTLTVCMSKGLGAPAGSLVVGSADLIRRCRRLRKRLGGAMRQVGVLAAAGIYALDHNLPRLTEDHRRAKALAAALAPYGVVDPDRVETNIVLLDLGGSAWSATKFAAAAEYLGIRILAVSTHEVRLVLHADITETQLHQAIEALSALLDDRG